MRDWTIEQWFAGVATLVAVLALLRPEWEVLLHRVVGRLKLSWVSKTVEIGYGGAGATIALELVLRAKRADFFIREGVVQVVREQDGARYTFTWAGLRPPGSVFPSLPMNIQIPAGFLLEPRNPQRLHLVFQDERTRERVLEAVAPAQRLFFERMSSLELPPDLGLSPDHGESGSKAFEKIYADVSAGSEWTEAWTRLTQICYWQAGTYRLEVSFLAVDPVYEVRRTFRFNLTQQHSDSLYRNAAVTQRHSIGRQDWQFYLARVPLEPIDD